MASASTFVVIMIVTLSLFALYWQCTNTAEGEYVDYERKMPTGTAEDKIKLLTEMTQFPRVSEVVWRRHVIISVLIATATIMLWWVAQEQGVKPPDSAIIFIVLFFVSFLCSTFANGYWSFHGHTRVHALRAASLLDS